VQEVVVRLTLLTYGRADVIKIFLCPSLGNIFSEPMVGLADVTSPKDSRYVVDDCLHPSYLQYESAQGGSVSSSKGRKLERVLVFSNRAFGMHSALCVIGGA